MNSVRAALLLGPISLPAAAHGQCVVFDTPEDLFAVTNVVFVGTVVMNEPTGARGNHVIVNLATLRPERTWKGRIGRNVRVGFDGPLEVGKKYIVFALGNQRD